MNDSLKTRLAQARARLDEVFPVSTWQNVVSESFNAAAAIAREVVAEKDAEISRLESRLESFKEQIATWRSLEQERRDEIARLEAEYDSAFRSPNELRKQLNAAEPRKVSDAQRKLDKLREMHKRMESEQGPWCQECGSNAEWTYPCDTVAIIESPADTGWTLNMGTDTTTSGHIADAEAAT